MFEMYDPSSQAFDWIRQFLLFDDDEHLSGWWKMMPLPWTEISLINPSGGVTASNPIGATAMVRS
ncbi:MAG: hypothetical protein R2860_14450 [Desulfobacterales bacterium]